MKARQTRSPAHGPRRPAPGWGALLAGDLSTLAVTIDGLPEAVYTPARGTSGGLDPADVLADLVEMHQDVTADDIARQLLAESEATDF